MIKFKDEYIEYIKELLEPYGISKIRAMFGGYGIYKNDIMCALIADQEIYFKADQSSAEYFANFGSTPFVYESKGKAIKLSYWKVPAEILEDNEQLEKWFELAYSSAISKYSSK